MTTEHSVTLSQEIEWAGRAISDCHPSVRQLFRVLFSDAIARRIRMRFLGTGVGRFSLTLSKFTIQQLLVRSINRYTKIAIAADWLRTVTHLDLAPTSMIESDARSLPFGQNSFNLVLTSPPYLPASSGRESYAMARAPSLVALGYRYANEIDALSNHSIGAMKVSSTPPDSLSPDERHLVNWLQRDPLRKIKAQPTARYFMDMRASFAEMHRILEPGGICAVVSGKQNTFYRFSDRKILYVAETAKWLAQEAELVGLKVEDSYDLQLVKPNRNARPRSLDDYYETILIFSKPH